MTKAELRKIFDDAEKAICTPENYQRVLAEITDSSKLSPSDEKDFSMRVNQIVNREILFEVLVRVLGCK